MPPCVRENDASIHHKRCHHNDQIWHVQHSTVVQGVAVQTYTVDIKECARNFQSAAGKSHTCNKIKHCHKLQQNMTRKI
jgi:hypothetical protein